mgnify:CR=1 FL=1
MKVRASLKKRTPECKIVRRNGRLYVINKKILSINNVKDNLLFCKKNNLVYGYKNSWCRFTSK